MNDFQKLFWISILHRWYKFSCKRLSIFLSKWYKNVTLSILYLKVHIISTMPLKTSWPLSFPNIRIMRIGFYYIQHLDSSCVLECLRLRHPKWDTRVCIWFKSIIGLSKTEKNNKETTLIMWSILFHFTLPIVDNGNYITIFLWTFCSSSYHTFDVISNTWNR